MFSSSVSKITQATTGTLSSISSIILFSNDVWTYGQILWTLMFSIIIVVAILGNTIVIWIILGELEGTGCGFIYKRSNGITDATTYIF